MPLCGRIRSPVSRPSHTGRARPTSASSAVLNTHGVPFSVTAEIETSGAGADGVLAAIGGVTSGWSLYVKDGKPAFDYNFFDVEKYRTQSSQALPTG